MVAKECITTPSAIISAVTTSAVGFFSSRAEAVMFDNIDFKTQNLHKNHCSYEG